jgi:threonine dehydratase
MEFAAIERARSFLRDRLPLTRLVHAESLSRISGAEVFLKLETEFPTGSFKVRGALNALRCAREQGPLSGVVTSSTGNHGAAVAYAARALAVPATVFLPERSNPVKRSRIASLGARIVETGRDLEESRQDAARFADERRHFNVVDGQNDDITAGAGTMACEILEQLPETSAIYIPIGDSSLIRGVAFAAKHLKPDLRIIGIQAEGAPVYYCSWKDGRVATCGPADTIADGMAARVAREENVVEIRRWVDDIVLVSDTAMLRAIAHLLIEEHVVAEPSGAASTAALLAAGSVHAGQRVVLIVTGANISPDVLRQAVEHSLSS